MNEALVAASGAGVGRGGGGGHRGGMGDGGRSGYGRPGPYDRDRHDRYNNFVGGGGGGALRHGHGGQMRWRCLFFRLKFTFFFILVQLN